MIRKSRPPGNTYFFKDRSSIRANNLAIMLFILGILCLQTGFLQLYLAFLNCFSTTLDYPISVQPELFAIFTSTRQGVWKLFGGSFSCRIDLCSFCVEAKGFIRAIRTTKAFKDRIYSLESIPDRSNRICDFDKRFLHYLYGIC